MTWFGHPFPADELPSQETALHYALVCGIHQLTNFLINVGKTLLVR